MRWVVTLGWTDYWRDRLYDHSIPLDSPIMTKSFTKKDLADFAKEREQIAKDKIPLTKGTTRGTIGISTE